MAARRAAARSNRALPREPSRDRAARDIGPPDDHVGDSAHGATMLHCRLRRTRAACHARLAGAVVVVVAAGHRRPAQSPAPRRDRRRLHRQDSGARAGGNRSAPMGTCAPISASASGPVGRWSYRWSGTRAPRTPGLQSWSPPRRCRRCARHRAHLIEVPEAFWNFRELRRWR